MSRPWSSPAPWIVTLAAVLPLLGSSARAEDGAGYEQPPRNSAERILAEPLRKGPHHAVRSPVELRRFLDRYELESPYGLFRVSSRRLLEIRVHEVETIARVVDMEGAPEGLRALGRSLGRLPGAVVEIVLHPIDSAEKIGQGLEKTWGRIEDLFRDRRRSVYEASAAGNAFSGDEKRHLAAELNLDVYSTNPRVQEFLDEIAGWRAAGNLTLDVATFALPLVGYLAVNTTKWRADVQRLLRDKSPAELDRHNAAVLLGLGIPREVVARFLRNDWLSPRHRSVITGALSQMKGVEHLGAALEAASSARDEVGALYQEQQAVLLAHHHEHERPFAALERVRHVVVGRTKSPSSLVVMLPADQLYWMEDFDHLIQEIQALARNEAQVRTHVYTTGRITPRARQALGERGVTIESDYRPAIQ